MKKGFVLLREFTYGYDFTEFGNDEEIIIHETYESASDEVIDEYLENIHLVKESEKKLDDLSFDLIVAVCDYNDKKIIVYDDEKSYIITEHVI